MSQSSRLRICQIRKSKIEKEEEEEEEEEEENHARTTGDFNEKMYTTLNCQSYQWMRLVISLQYRPAPKLRLKQCDVRNLTHNDHTMQNLNLTKTK